MSYADQQLTCVECAQPVASTADEQAYFAERGYTNAPSGDTPMPPGGAPRAALLAGTPGVEAVALAAVAAGLVASASCSTRFAPPAVSQSWRGGGP